MAVCIRWEPIVTIKHKRWMLELYHFAEQRTPGAETLHHRAAHHQIQLSVERRVLHLDPHPFQNLNFSVAFIPTSVLYSVAAFA